MISEEAGGVGWVAGSVKPRGSLVGLVKDLGLYTKSNGKLWVLSR